MKSAQKESFNVLALTVNANLITFLKEAIQTFEINISFAGSIEKAISECMRSSYQLTIIDAKQDELSYDDIINMLRQTEQNRTLPVLLIIPETEINDVATIENKYVDLVYPPLHYQAILKKIFWHKDFIEQYENLYIENETLRDKIKRLPTRNEAHKILQDELAILASMSHEIRTPLSAIIGFTNMLASPELDQIRRQQFIEYVQDSGKTLIQLLDNIIDYAKLETGELTLLQQEVKLHKLLWKLKYNAERQIFESLKEVNIILDIIDPDKDMIILTDEVRFKQIISNLLNNAVKYTQKGSITLGYRYSKHNKELYFFIEDTGIGIPENKLEHVFTRFGQVKDKRMSNISGGGLGLAIVKSLIKLFNGFIEVESKENVGTKFCFTLREIQLYEASTDNVKMEANERYNFTNLNILIVEDDEVNSQYLTELFKLTSANIFNAYDGQEAIDAVARQHFDIILMDLRLPVINGYKAIEEIKKINPHIPVIAQTACTMSDERMKCIAAGFDEYMVKPINPDYLFKAINKITKNETVKS